MALKSKTKLAAILGARPNFIKAAPLLHKAQSTYPEFEFHLIHTGQHYDANMSQVFFDELGIPTPQTQLHIGDHTLSEKMARMINGIRQALVQIRPKAVLVFGDVNSSLAGAIATLQTGLTLVHIEAGLRSHDRRMPEETNRFLIDHMSALLFVTEPDGYANLVKEGVPDSKIRYVGNLMIEALETYQPKIEMSPILRQLKLKPHEYVVATIHRDENIATTKSLVAIVDLLEFIAKDNKVILPLHPHTRNLLRAAQMDKRLRSVKLIEPLGYFDFIKLVSESNGVITDSGGIQEETSHLGIPCATLRDNTERPITLTQGTNRLFSLSDQPDLIFDHLQQKDLIPKTIPFWDDQVSHRILTELKIRYCK